MFHTCLNHHIFSYQGVNLILKPLSGATTSLSAIQPSVKFQPDRKELSTAPAVSKETTTNDKQSSPQHLTVPTLPGRPTSKDKQLPPDTKQSLATPNATPVAQGNLYNNMTSFLQNHNYVDHLCC